MQGTVAMDSHSSPRPKRVLGPDPDMIRSLKEAAAELERLALSPDRNRSRAYRKEGRPRSPDHYKKTKRRKALARASKKRNRL